MDNYQLICAKLEAFIKKYYTNELIKGAILFFAVGLLYFLLLVCLEYFFWLGKMGRSILFWSFFGVELGLFIRFILLPLFHLFNISKGISLEKAAEIIGHHFPAVSDKLLNVLQLKQQSGNSDLLLAGIDQKAAELKPIPFQFAVDFKGNLQYLKYAIIPILIILAIYISGNTSLFSDSYQRIVHYDRAYEPPAPFQFIIGNDALQVRQNEIFTLKVKVKGKILPQEVSIHFNNETYFLAPVSPTIFKYQFENLAETTSFYLSANKVRSQNYSLNVIAVPTVLDFEMHLDYPGYTAKKDETIKGTGNATFPEGTLVSWQLKTHSTDRVELKFPDTTRFFAQKNNQFHVEQRIYNSKSYQISTSNREIQAYEKLNYTLKVVKDEFPVLELEMKRDSIAHRSLYFHGSISDDYGLSKLELVYYPSNNPKEKEVRSVPISNANFDEFLFTFPGTLDLKKGTAYEFYFQVFDNDGIHGAKKTKSKVYAYRKLTDAEKEEQLLEKQEKAIQGMQKSLKNLGQSEKEISALSELQKQQKQWSFSDRKKLQNFLERQKHQREMMMDYNKKLQENLKEFQPQKKEDPYKKALQERLERNEKKLNENEELLKKLEEYAKKINKENLGEELEKLAKQNINQQKNLAQLLELTKRYYVEQKAKKIAEDLSRLSEKQEALSHKNEKNNKQAQDSLTKKFDKIKKEMDALKKENKGLKKPMELGMEEKTKQAISQKQNQASEKLEQAKNTEKTSQQKQRKSEAKKSQQEAAKKMKKLSQQMQSKMQAFSLQAQAEDAEMLRQILDNLITFSFQQEDLMKDFQTIDERNPIYVEKLKHQNMLRTNFEHVDDSLFALALRNPMVSGRITEKLTDIAFNIDKSITHLAENNIRQSSANQQYTVTSANDLALMLGNILSQMQMNRSGIGKGKKGKKRGFQLPDIIKKQGEIGEKMKESMGKGKKPGKQNGKQGKPKEGQMGKSQGERGKAEGMSGALYEIYKQQQLLRHALEEKIKEAGLGGKAKQLAQKMEKIENELLLNGFNEETLHQIMALKHQLMKLENATYKQGKEAKRESTTNFDTFQNTTEANLKKAKEYFNTTEILNRQRLPLRQNYEDLVEEYFKKE